MDIWKDFALRRTGVGVTARSANHGLPIMVRQSCRKREIAGWGADEVGLDGVNGRSRALEGCQRCVFADNQRTTMRCVRSVGSSICA